jgi:hypothetical protein
MKSRVRVYVAGAYGAKDALVVWDNMRRGMRLGYEVLRAGFAPFVPWFDYHFSLMGPMELEEYYEYSMAWLEVSDAVLVAPVNLEGSKGTQAEVARAHELGIPVFYEIECLKAWAEKNCAAGGG